MSNKLEVPVATIVLATIVVFFAGFGGAWLIFGLDFSVNFGDSAGSRADWIAAVGTWIIGIAATFVAAMAFLHGQGQTKNTRTSLLNYARLAIVDAISIEITINGFLKRDKGIQKWQDFREILENLHAESEPIRIEPSVLPHMPSKVNRQIVSINMRLKGFRNLINDRIFKCPDDKLDHFVGADVLGAFEALLEYVRVTDEMCKDYVRWLKEELDR